MRICSKCGKRAMRANLVSHSQRKTRRPKQSNLFLIRTESGRIKICAKCLKRLRNPRPKKGRVKA